jgi:ketosteroid isomerase-like protein
MYRRSFVRLSILTAFGLAFLPANVSAQQADVDGVKAASKAFYDALMTIDQGEAMEKVWAHTAYVTNTSPRSKTIIVGWDAIKKYWPETNGITASRAVSLSDQHIHVNGNMAYEIAQENGTVKFKDGKEGKVDWIVTNVYERLDGRWLIISHQVQQTQ